MEAPLYTGTSTYVPMLLWYTSDVGQLVALIIHATNNSVILRSRCYHNMVAILLWIVIAASFVEALQVSAPQLALPHTPSSPVYPLRKLVSHYVTSDDSSIKENESRTPNSENERAEAVGNLLANDEWEGLTMELSQLIRTAVVEDMKSNAREFLRSDNYDLGDISRELDDRVKNEVARLRGKEVNMHYLDARQTMCERHFYAGAHFLLSH